MAEGARQQQRALAEVVEQKSGPHDEEPGDPHRLAAEMTHVDVERLAAGQHQEHGAEDHDREARVAEQHAERVHGIERHQDFGRVNDLAQAEQPDRDEPDDHDRAEQPADALGAAALHRKQRRRG